MTTDPRRREVVLGLVALAACRPGPGLPPPFDGPPDPDSNFHAVYDVPALRERFRGFLEHVFTLYPPDAMHALVHATTRAHPDDEAIYRALLRHLPRLRPLGAALTYDLPALRQQKEEMARQAAALLSERRRIEGYLELGTTGRYHNALARRIPIEGPVFVLNDVEPSWGPVDVLERGQLAAIGTYVPLGAYDPIDSSVPDGSVEVVSDLIGLHHCPAAALEAFVDSLRRVLAPGGVLLIREHDARDAEMQRMVALAHDVFNAGVRLSWEENAAQVRHFRSVDDWIAYLGAHGFRSLGRGLRQAGDPTDNELLAFVRA